MLSATNEFYGNMDSHQPANCRLGDVIEAMQRRLAQGRQQGTDAAEREESQQAGSYIYLAQQPLDAPGEAQAM